MKKLTKEWYAMTQRTEMESLWRIDKKAETYSEEYFRSLYAKKEKEFMQDVEEYANATFDDLYPETLAEVLGEEELAGVDQSSDEYQAAEAEYLADREAARAEYDAEDHTYDPEAAKKAFRIMYRDNIAYLRENLPLELLTKVADIRVMALGRVSAEIKQLTRAFSKQQEKEAERIYHLAVRESRRSFGRKKPAWLDELTFGGCMILKAQRRKGDLYITVDNEAREMDGCCRIRLKNAEIIETDGRLAGTEWFSEEIYRTEAGIEMHLLHLRDDEPLSSVIRFEDAELQNYIEMPQ